MTTVSSWYSKRLWNEPSRCETVDDLARKLDEYDWTDCTAFAFPDGAHVIARAGGPEWIVLEPRIGGGYRIIESISFGWLTSDRVAHALEMIDSGAYDDTCYGTLRDDQFRRHGINGIPACGACV